MKDNVEVEKTCFLSQYDVLFFVNYKIFLTNIEKKLVSYL